MIWYMEFTNTKSEQMIISKLVDISIILQKTSLVLLTKILPCIVLPQMRSNFKVTLKLSNN